MRSKDTMIYTRKAYRGENSENVFANIVEETQKFANSLEHHIELIEVHYPDHIIEPLWTYEHGTLAIERSPSCQWDSSLDGMCAYKSG